MDKSTITLRQIIKDTMIKLDSDGIIGNYDKRTDICIQQIKQKLAHLRRVLFHEIEISRLSEPMKRVPGSETFVIQEPLSTDKILDIFYTELDHCIEGLYEENKNLSEMSERLCE